MILTDAELTLGLSRHFKIYQMGPARAALENLEFAGQVLDVAFRLRGSTSNTPDRVTAIGQEVGLNSPTLTAVLATLESLGWASVQRDANKRPLSVSESIPAATDLVKATSDILKTLLVTDIELAALAILRATTIQPLTTEDALQAGKPSKTTGGDLAAETALRHLTFLRLVRRVEDDDGREVCFNPNIWVHNEETVKAALRAADANGTSEVSALLEELAENPGLPETHVSACDTKWVKFSISQGLVQRSVIQTSSGTEQGFLFSPHLGRDPFGGTAGDASGHVRQLVGSMIFATTFATYKLNSPEQFLSALITRGTAGNVTSIGTDYPMLEKAGIVRVIPGSGGDKKRLELLQSEVAEDALKILRGRPGPASGGRGVEVLAGQSSYSHVDQERAKLANDADIDQLEQQRLVSALRDISFHRGKS